MLRVLYEDNHTIAVLKPAGMLTQGDSSGAESLMDVTKAWVKRERNKSGDVFLGLVHRLDRPVAGVVVFGKTSKGAARLSEQFRARTVTKIYHALVEGIVAPPSGRLEHFLCQPDGKGPSVALKSASPGAQHASLSYRVFGARSGDSLVEITLETGRKHQIRAQFAAIGHPIIGDRKYGSMRSWDPPSTIALVAKRLEFNHATRREDRIAVEVPEQLSPLN